MTPCEDRLKAIEEAILQLQKGERIASVSYEGYTVHYAPLQIKELIALRDKILSEIKKSRSSTTRIQVITSKGTE